MKGRGLSSGFLPAADGQHGLGVQSALHFAVEHGPASLAGGSQIGARHAAPQRHDAGAQDLHRAFHLGKYIYLLDAYDDLERDQRKGAYNPLKTLSQQPGYEEEMREIFELLLARCAKSFERLPCVEDADLQRNILYSGVWLKYNCKNAKKEK